MTLHDHLINRIKQSGPMSVAEYMTVCLQHPEHGYYTSRDPLGAEGDFTTAPEISQMFGELLGLALAQSWLDQGAPARFTLCELGPGRGTLMADLMRATRTVPGFQEAAELHLVELSPALRKKQAEALSGYDPVWLDDVAELPDQPLFLVANEFFDVLPIRQFVRTGNLWRERRIGAEGGVLAFGLDSALPQPALANRLDDTADGDLVEQSPALAPTVDAIGSRIDTRGGAALIVDYGDWGSLGDTFQAVRAHKKEDPLQRPGACDLTAHVDFEALSVAAPCAHTRLTSQGIFLERLGITQRAQALAQTLDGADLERHIAAHRRLTHPAEMGNLFKVIGLYPTDKAAPPGLTT